MGKGANKLEAIDQQNKLLREQNDLLRKQIELMKNSSAQSKHDEREIFIDNIDRDEIRSGLLVSARRKKLWNVQLNLINELARICKKHNLRWFIYAGTLLGAARHKGFIPWDDDVDVAMLRPDYEKFKRIMEVEAKNQSPYSTWYWFNYRLETDVTADKADLSLPLISKAQADAYPGWAPFQPIIRLLDKRTTFLQHDARKDVYSSIFLDVFPLDPCPPFDNEITAQNFERARELFLATVLPEKIRKLVANGGKFLWSHDELRRFLNLPYKRRACLLEEFQLKTFTKSKHLSELKYFSTYDKKISMSTEDFEDVVYLPFEKTELPAPKGYEQILTDFYGDWHKMVITHTHGNEYSADIPYAEYRKKSLRFASQKGGN